MDRAMAGSITNTTSNTRGRLLKSRRFIPEIFSEFIVAINVSEKDGRRVRPWLDSEATFELRDLIN